MEKGQRENLLYFLAVAFVYTAMAFIVVNSTLVFAGFRFANPILPALVSFAAFAVAALSTLKLRKSFLFLFATCFCLLTSGLFFFFFFVSRHKMTSGVLWPLLVVFCGFSFLFAGAIKKRKIVSFYSVIALAFIILGICFFLLSSNILSISLASVFLYFFIPFILIFLAAAGAFLNNYAEKSNKDKSSIVTLFSNRQD